MLNHRAERAARGKQATGAGPYRALLSAKGRGRLPLLLLALGCVVFAASCRMDMQDQPKYKVYRSSGFFKDGLSSRPLPEGTVPRGYLRADQALYTGKSDRAQAGQSASGGQTSQGQQNQDGRGAGQAGQGPSGGTGTNTGGATAAAGAGGAGQQRSAGGANGGGGGNSGGAGGANGAGNAYAGDVDAFPFPVTAEVVERGRERYQIFCSMCHGLSGYGDGMIVRRGFRKPPSYYEDNLRRAPVGHFYDVITNGWGSMPNYAAQVPVEDRWAIIAYIRALQLTVPPAPQGANNGAQGPQTQGPQSSQTPNTGGQR